MAARDPHLDAATAEARLGLAEGGIPIGSVLVHRGAILLYGIPQVVVGENRTFMGEEDLLRSRGVGVQVVQDPACIQLMQDFIARRPDLWNEDIGEP